ncbi:MAG: thioredoxin [Robiginitomaculum sp.]|nr:thioredoxin [Robiginitomaculum sp.]
MPNIDEDNEYIIDGTDADFMKQVVEPSASIPVIVDFWAPWCGPCKTLKPMLEKLVAAEGGKVKLVKVNTDEQQGIAGQLRVRSIPAVFAFKDGKPVDGFVGAQPESKLAEFIETQKAKFETA